MLALLSKELAEIAAAMQCQYSPVGGRGTPLFPLVHLLPHLFPLLFSFFHWLYLFSSFVHPFRFYLN